VRYAVDAESARIGTFGARKNDLTATDADPDGLRQRFYLLMESEGELLLGPTNFEVGQQILAGFCWDSAGNGGMQAWAV